MSTYNFKASKPSLFVLTLIFSLLGGIFLFGALDSILGILPKDNIYYFILSFGVLFVLSIFFTRLISFAKVEITLVDDTISIKWLERFLFNKKSNVTLSFNEMAAYVVRNDQNWDWIKIEMTNGSIYKIYHSTFLTKDEDYSEFISAFVSSVENYNNAIYKSAVNSNLTEKPKAIKRAKSIYEGVQGLVLAGFAILVIIGLPILLFVVPSTKEPNYFLFAVGYFGAVYYLIQVYTIRKKNKTDDKK